MGKEKFKLDVVVPMATDHIFVDHELHGFKRDGIFPDSELVCGGEGCDRIILHNFNAVDAAGFLEEQTVRTLAKRSSCGSINLLYTLPANS